jgi:hypothetical protein
MSQERRERQKEKLGIRTSSRNWRRIAIYAVLIMVAFGLAYYLSNRADHRHDAFARCLTDRGVKMYGAWWCPHCQEQKEKFGASFEYVPYVECGIKGDCTGDRRLAEMRTSSTILPGSFRLPANEWSAFSVWKN